MQTFDEIEAKNKQVHVRLTGDVVASGVLMLDRRRTEIRLTSERPLPQRRDENGWFDLHLRTADGATVLLHNAIQTRSTTHGSSRDVETAIFPNVIAISQDPDPGQLRSISFALQGLKSFFHYEHVEWQSVAVAPPEFKQALKLLRREKVHKYGFERKYDFFRPSDIFITHRVPRTLKFRIDDRCYEIGTSGRQTGLGWGRVELHMEPVAKIVFDSLTPIDTALEHVREWRRFFVQIAMEPMPFLAISGRTKRTYRSPDVQIYLPNLDEQQPKESRFNLDAGSVPFNHWHERRKLASAMQNWLAKRNERETFRGLLDEVIVASDHRSDINDVVRLCAAVESLDELKERSTVTKAHLSLMAAASAKAMSEAGVIIDEDRIRQVLSSFRRPSLSKRMQLLGERLEPILDVRDTTLVAAEAQRLRNHSAHGKSADNSTISTVGPVVEALASMCALFDLTSSGIPAANEQARVSSVVRAQYAAAGLRQFVERAS